MKTNKNIGFILFLLTIFFSCSKDKRISNRIDGKTFCIQNYSIDGDSKIPYDTLVFDECRIYKELCIGTWKRNGGKTQFYWQINEKGKQFKISNITTLENTSGNNPNFYATTQCYNLSGTYEILEYNKKGEDFTLKLKSSSTKGFNGQVVEFSLKILN